ncbi:AMP-binding protein [Haloarchaeobius sp. DFWS5]|uniref:AMP-binding protein n=1 Tax=Haloarchaeobius sp. DFWS5 TaxID=3446114 RepID=UPI003EBD2CA5
METLADVLARDRRSDAPALFVAGTAVQRYDYRRLLTTAWKAANFLHHQGVREGSTVAVVSERRAQPVLAFLGASLLGARTRFDWADEATGTVALDDARVLVAPHDELASYALPAGAQYVGYGDDSTDPAHHYWEGEVWSENPTMPPEPCLPDTEILLAGTRGYSHTELLQWAETAHESLSLAGDEQVAVRTSLDDPRTLGAGVLAPLLAGSEILFPDDETQGDVAVTRGDDDCPEKRVFELDSVVL